MLLKKGQGVALLYHFKSPEKKKNPHTHAETYIRSRLCFVLSQDTVVTMKTSVSTTLRPDKLLSAVCVWFIQLVSCKLQVTDSTMCFNNRRVTKWTNSTWSTGDAVFKQYIYTRHLEFLFSANAYLYYICIQIVHLKWNIKINFFCANVPLMH